MFERSKSWATSPRTLKCCTASIREPEMKTMTTSEKFALIRHHAERLTMAGVGAPMTKRSDVLESAQRIIELSKSIPKAEWGTE